MRQLILIVALLLGSAAQARPITAGQRYVAMGSSFAAGTGIGGIKPGTPLRCGRSPMNYASLVAERLKLDLDDQTCGGARTEHILRPWGELQAQIDAVNLSTRLVTVTIGGNDLSYVTNLAAGACNPAEGLALEGRKMDCPILRTPTAADYATLEGNLRKIAREVHKRAPNARLVFVQYVTLVPDPPCAALGLSPDGVMINREIGERLARITTRAARAEGAEILQSQELSRQHTSCDAQPWSVGPKATGPSGPTPWHPNGAGHLALADSLLQMLQR